MTKVFSFIYRKGLDPKGGSNPWRKLTAKFFRLIRQCVLRAADPACKMNIWGRPMYMPFSHELPSCLARGWHYDQVLLRISNHIRSTQGPICGIDVGANVGDTIVAVLNDDKDKFLGIEPNRTFFRYLTRNLGGKPNVQLLKTVCSARDSVTPYLVTTGRGTSRFEKCSQNGEQYQTECLDTIVARNHEFFRCNFLKIDTDGNDFEVLRGARKLIANAKPAVLFECEMRDNANYIEDVFEAFKFFSEAGYAFAIVYDNDGELLGPLDLKALSNFAQGLFYQLTSHKLNFDVLLMPDAGSFLSKELDFFANATGTIESRTAAQKAAKLVQARFTAG